MHRLTTVSFVLFIVLSMALAIFSGKARTSVMEDVEVAAPAAEVEVQTGGTDGTVMDSPEEAGVVPTGGEGFLEVEETEAETAPAEPDQE